MAITVKTKKVVFSDGSNLVVSESNWDIAMKLSQLENQAQDNPHENNDIQLFRVAFYPKLVACVVKGDAPTEEEARSMPETELDKWYMAVKEMNPKWFAAVDEAVSEADQAKKKKRRRMK